MGPVIWAVTLPSSLSRVVIGAAVLETSVYLLTGAVSSLFTPTAVTYTTLLSESFLGNALVTRLGIDLFSELLGEGIRSGKIEDSGRGADFSDGGLRVTRRFVLSKSFALAGVVLGLSDDFSVVTGVVDVVVGAAVVDVCCAAAVGYLLPDGYLLLLLTPGMKTQEWSHSCNSSTVSVHI